MSDRCRCVRRSVRGGWRRDSSRDRSRRRSSGCRRVDANDLLYRSSGLGWAARGSRWGDRRTGTVLLLDDDILARVLVPGSDVGVRGVVMVVVTVGVDWVN